MIQTFNNVLKVDGAAGDAGLAYGVDINNIFDIVSGVRDDTSTATMKTSLEVYSTPHVLGGTANNVIITGGALPELDHDFDLLIKPLFNNSGPTNITIHGTSIPLVDSSTAPLTANSIILGNEVKVRYNNAINKFTLSPISYNESVGKTNAVVSGQLVVSKDVINDKYDKVIADSATNANSVVVIAGLGVTSVLEITIIDKLLGDIYKAIFKNNSLYVESNHTSTNASGFIDVAGYSASNTIYIQKQNPSTKFGQVVVIVNKFIMADASFGNLNISFGNTVPSATGDKKDVRELVTGGAPANPYQSFLPRDINISSIDTSIEDPMLRVNGNLDATSNKDYLIFNINVGGTISQYAINALEPYLRLHRKTTNATFAGIAWTAQSILDSSLLTNIIGSSSGNAVYNTTKKLRDLIVSAPTTAGHPLNGGVGQSLLVPSIPISQHDVSSIGYAIDTYLPTSYSGANIEVTYLHGTKLDSRLVESRVTITAVNANYRRKFAAVTGVEAPTIGPNYLSTSHFLDDNNGFQLAAELKAYTATANKQHLYLRWFSGDGVSAVTFDPWIPLNVYDTYSTNIVDQQYTEQNGRLKSNMGNGTVNLIFEETINHRELQDPMIKVIGRYSPAVTVNGSTIGFGGSTRSSLVNYAYVATYTSVSVGGVADCGIVTNRNVFLSNTGRNYSHQYIDLDTGLLVSSDVGHTTATQYASNPDTVGSAYTFSQFSVASTTYHGMIVDDTLYATNIPINATGVSVTAYSAKRVVPLTGGRVKYGSFNYLTSVCQSSNMSVYGMNHQYHSWYPTNLQGKRLSRYQNDSGVHLVQVSTHLGDRFAMGERPWSPYYPWLGGVGTTNNQFLLEINSTHCTRMSLGGFAHYAVDNKLSWVGFSTDNRYLALPSSGGVVTPIETQLAVKAPGRVQHACIHNVGTVLYVNKTWVHLGYTTSHAAGGSTNKAFVTDPIFARYTKEITKPILTDIIQFKFCSV